MRRNPLLYSDQAEVEEINTIEPIEEKRSFVFYFIVFANSLLVILVLVVIWSLFAKPTDTSFDQQLKTWTEQLFNPKETAITEVTNNLAPTATPTPTVKAPTSETKTEAESVATQAKELEALRLEKERIEEELALKAEQVRLEKLAATLQEEKNKAEVIQQAASEVTADASEEIEEQTEEAAIVPNAARDVPEQPDDGVKTQLEQILETMQNQQ